MSQLAIRKTNTLGPTACRLQDQPESWEGWVKLFRIVTVKIRLCLFCATCLSSWRSESFQPQRPLKSIPTIPFESNTKPASTSPQSHQYQNIKKYWKFKTFFFYFCTSFLFRVNLFLDLNILDWPRAAAELMNQHENGSFEKMRFLIFNKYWAISAVSTF